MYFQAILSEVCEKGGKQIHLHLLLPVTSSAESSRRSGVLSGSTPDSWQEIKIKTE
jgi:hypothetical protein